MNSHTISFIPLLIVVMLAFLVPIILNRFKKIGIPIVVGEIIAGIIVGQSGFQLVGENAVLEILSVLGFALLMFLSGLEIDFARILTVSDDSRSNRLDRLLKNPLIFGVLIFLLTFGGAGVAAWLIHDMNLVSEPWIMALILSTTSLGVVVPVLKERGFTGTLFGQRILSAAVVADFISILAISIYVLLRSQGLTLELLLVLVLFAVFIAVHRLTALFQKHLPTEKILDKLASPAAEIKLRGAIALALVFIALAESLGIENILGAFLAGVILSLASSGDSSILRQKLDGIGYGFFIPIFFVMVGVQFNLPVLLESREALLLVPLMLGTAFLVKMLPAFLFRRFHSWKETFAAGFLLSSRLSLIIAASAIGFQLGVISPALNSSIILVAIFTCTLAPIGFNLLMGKSEIQRDRVLVVGKRLTVDLLLKNLKEHGIEGQQVKISSIENDDLTVRGQDLLPQSEIMTLLRENQIRSTRALIALDESDERNLRVCRVARQIFDVETVIALVHDPRRNPQFRKLGVRVVNQAYSTSLIIESMILSKEAFSLAADLDELQEVREVKLQNRALHGIRVADLTLPDDVSVLLIGRGGESLAPDGNTILQTNDRITLVGEESGVEEALPLFAREGR